MYLVYLDGESIKTVPLNNRCKDELNVSYNKEKNERFSSFECEEILVTFILKEKTGYIFYYNNARKTSPIQCLKSVITLDKFLLNSETS